MSKLFEQWQQKHQPNVHMEEQQRRDNLWNLIVVIAWIILLWALVAMCFVL